MLLLLHELHAQLRGHLLELLPLRKHLHLHRLLLLLLHALQLQLVLHLLLLHLLRWKAGRVWQARLLLLLLVLQSDRPRWQLLPGVLLLLKVWVRQLLRLLVLLYRRPQRLLLLLLLLWPGW